MGCLKATSQQSHLFPPGILRCRAAEGVLSRLSEVRRVQPLPYHPSDGRVCSKLHEEDMQGRQLTGVQQDRQTEHCLLAEAHPDPTDGHQPQNGTGDGMRTHPLSSKPLQGILQEASVSTQQR